MASKDSGANDLSSAYGDAEHATAKAVLPDNTVSDQRARELALDDPLDLSKAPAISATTSGKAKAAIKAALTEGHTWWDATLSVACSSIGQIILTKPYQMASTGLIAGLTLYFGTSAISLYSIWLFTIMYAHRKQSLIKEGTWYDSTDENGYRRRSSTTQMHDLITFTGGRILGAITQMFIVFAVLGSGTIQIVASASSQYVIDKSYSKRTWSLILGPVLGIFAFLPSARNNRLLNVIGLFGTNYSCLYFFINAVARGAQPHTKKRLFPPNRRLFFNGAAVMGGGSGNFSAAIEMMDSMRTARRFDFAFAIGVIWTTFLTVPHTTAIVVAYPDVALKQANVYSILPNSTWKTASVWIMLIHNIAAFTLHVQPVMFIWEKWVRTHTKPTAIRLASRIPVVLLIWLISIAIPFYGGVNSLFSALYSPAISFILPPLAFTMFYWKKENRDACPKKIPGILAKWNWTPLFLVNIFLVVFFTVFGSGFQIYYGIVTLVNDIHKYKFFAKCYQCAGST